MKNSRSFQGLRCFIVFCLMHSYLDAILLPVNPIQRFLFAVKPIAEKKNHYPLLSGNTFRSFCDAWVDETCKDFDPSLVKRGNAIFVSMKYLTFFLDTILPEIKHPFILVTSNENEQALSTWERNGAIDDRYLSYLEDGKIFHWFGRNVIAKHSRLSCIPLGVTWRGDIPHSLIEACFSNLTVENYFSPKKIYCYLNIRNTHPSRVDVLNFFSKQPFCTTSKFVPFETYIADLTLSRFVISPRGFNLDCFRTWEALYAGSIPIVESTGIESIYEGLPVIIVPNINSMTKEFLDTQFEELRGKTFHLERLHAKYWLDQIQVLKERCLFGF